MKVKTSITINNEILKKIDESVEHTQNRSKFIETAVIYYIKHYRKTQRDINDLKIINRNHNKYNKEAEDLLSYQEL